MQHMTSMEEKKIIILNAWLQAIFTDRGLNTTVTWSFHGTEASRMLLEVLSYSSKPVWGDRLANYSVHTRPN